MKINLSSDILSLETSDHKKIRNRVGKKTLKSHNFDTKQAFAQRFTKKVGTILLTERI